VEEIGATEAEVMLVVTGAAVKLELAQLPPWL